MTHESALSVKEKKKSQKELDVKAVTVYHVGIKSLV